VKEDDENEKFSLIDEIIQKQLIQNPSRSEDWYGETFDKLIDCSVYTLTLLKNGINNPYKNRGKSKQG